MEDNKQSPNKDAEDFPNLWNRLEVPIGRDKAVVWSELSAQIQQESTVHSMKSHWWKKMLVAASLLILIGIASMRYYTITIQSVAGQQLSHSLPDGSKVYLNVASSVTYPPYWWFAHRELTLEGEAFFEVKKGNKFEVKSTQATTTVLGTSFNIFARDNQYKVYCKTGKIRVAASSKEVILLPTEQVDLIHSDLIKSTVKMTTVPWRENKFSFQQAPLSFVIQEIERYYAIQVDIDSKGEKKVYTGFFERAAEEEATLQIIGASLGLTVKKVAKKHYVLE